MMLLQVQKTISKIVHLNYMKLVANVFASQNNLHVIPDVWTPKLGNVGESVRITVVCPTRAY